MEPDRPHLLAAHAVVPGLEELLGERLVSVVLYGSVVHGRERPDSDVDLLVVATELPNGPWRRRDLLRPVIEPAEDALRVHRPHACIAEVVKTPEEVRRGGPLYYDMTVPDERVLLLDRGGFFAAWLAELGARMAAYGSVRMTRHTGQKYWDLKLDFRPGDVLDL